MPTFNAQEYLDKNWTDKNITKINFQGENKLNGELIIQDFPNLEEIYLPQQELTALTVINCPLLKNINARSNQLTKLDLEKVKVDTENKPISNEISKIIAGSNELAELDLTTCQSIKELLVPDNPYLTEIKGLNLVEVKNINISNTLVALSQDYEELKQKYEGALEIVKKTKEGAEEKGLVITEAIQTTEQADEAIRRHLEKTKKEWRENLKHPENALPSFQIPESRRKAKQILILISTALTTKNYQRLVNEWNEEDDFSGSLDRLKQLLRAQNYFAKKTNKQNLAQPLLMSNTLSYDQQ